MANFTIRVGEFNIPAEATKNFRIPTTFKHIVIGVFDAEGKLVYEYNGLATDAKGNILPIGDPFDTTDTIQIYKRTSPYLWDNELTSDKVVLFEGTQEDVMAKLARADAAAGEANALKLGYELFEQNSNSAASTLLAAMGLKMPGTWHDQNVPGYRHRLLPSLGDLPGETFDPFGEVHGNIEPPSGSAISARSPLQVDKSRGRTPQPMPGSVPSGWGAVAEDEYEPE